jgi:hypothetical protein
MKRRVPGLLVAALAAACEGRASDACAHLAQNVLGQAATQASSATAVTWTVVEGSSGGTVSAAGLYTAPSAPGTYHVKVTSVASASADDTCTVTVTPVPPAGAVPPSPSAIRQLYPTVEGGREWRLPDGADLNTDPEFRPDPDEGTVTIVEAGAPTVYHTDGAGSDAEIRLNVHSPAGKAWWRNVEMTAYYRSVHAIGTAGPPHTEMVMRGGYHTSSMVARSSINDGVFPPAGAVTWPWWNAFAPGDTIIGSAEGTSYHGNLYFPPGVGSPVFWVSVEKEISHMQGYCGPRGTIGGSNHLPAQGQWFGEKFVIRNSVDGSRVKLEVWLDAQADGNWVKMTEYTDQNGAGNDWRASAIDGTDASPYDIALNQLITWAGPYAGFRADNSSLDFADLSVREIAPF